MGDAQTEFEGLLALLDEVKVVDIELPTGGQSLTTPPPRVS
jgi:hypothetical protein